MDRVVTDATPRTACTSYPETDPQTAGAIAERLVEVVALRHGSPLSVEQRSELATCVERQLAATERLHGFALSNAHEPAFVMPARQGGG